jgi:hypothetical protein
MSNGGKSDFPFFEFGFVLSLNLWNFEGQANDYRELDFQKSLFCVDAVKRKIRTYAFCLDRFDEPGLGASRLRSLVRAGRPCQFFTSSC